MASAMLKWLEEEGSTEEVEAWYSTTMERVAMGLVLKMMRQNMMREPKNVYPNHSPKAILRSV